MTSYLTSAMEFFGVRTMSTAIEDIDLPGEEEIINESANKFTTTENGSLAHNGTGDANLDLFIKSVRGLTGNDLEAMMRAAWDENPETMLQNVYNTRDCRTGKGERALFFKMAIWLRRNYWETYKLNMNNLINLGRFKDLIDINCRVRELNLDNSQYELKVLASYVAEDILRLKNEDITERNKITLAAKWIPTRDNNTTRKYKLTSRFINILLSSSFDYPNGWDTLIKLWNVSHGENCKNEIYRKEILSPLRKHLKLVETMMSQNNWETINFATVPSKAMAKYRKAFRKHVPEQLNEYLEKLKTGSTKINITGQTPYDLIHQVFSNYYNIENNDIIQAQWDALLQKAKSENQLTRTVSVVDVSGSMSGTPMEVAIAMGLFTSLIPDETDPFYRKMITFSETPAFHTLPNNTSTLGDMVRNIKRMNWGYNTDFNSVFKLILDMGKHLKLTQEQMPSRVIVYTDMQFDEAESKNKTNFQEITSMYAASGYVMPQMVFWNLRASSNKAMPVTKDEKGTAFLSGYSAELLKGLMNGDIDPIKIMMNILSKYNVLIHPSDLHN